MSRPVQYCDKLPRHASRRCLECKRIQMAVYRGKSMEEARGMAGPKQPTCRSCRVRFLVKPPDVRSDYRPILLTNPEILWLENAARLFDQLAGEDSWTAEDFIAWLKPDLSGRFAPHVPDMVGISVSLGGGRKGSGKGTTRIATADPLPMVPATLRKLVG